MGKKGKSGPPFKKAASQNKLKDEGSTSETIQPNTTCIVAKRNTLIVGNLVPSVDKQLLRSFFQGAGEILSICVATFDDGTCSGSAQLEFASPYDVERACRLSGTLLNGQAISLNFGHERLPINPDLSSLKKPPGFSANTILISSFDSAYDSVVINASIEQHFIGCGRIKHTHFPRDTDTGACVGVCFLEFENQSSVSAALKLNESLLDGFCLHVEEA